MTLKARWRAVRPYVLDRLLYGFARFVGMTARLRVEGLAELEALPQAKVYAGWHGRTLLAATLFRNKGIWTIISHSRDGEMQDRIMRRFGFHTIRGSSGRGGARAAAESIRVLKRGCSMAFTPDGPRGPSGVVQQGLMLMAKKSGALLVPVGVSARWRFLAPTWDRYMIPLPFSQAIMIFGDPIPVPSDASDEEVEQVRQRFETEMHRLEAEAERRMGHQA